MQTWTTLKELRAVNACEDRYNHLVNALGNNYGDDTPIDLLTILQNNGLADALWIPRHIVHGDHIHMRYRLFAVACAQDVLHLMDDPRSRNAVRVAHLHAYGEATDDELTAARAAARAAACEAARAAARTAAWAAACEAAWLAAWVAAWEAARAAACEAARTAARTAACEAARVRQIEWFEVVFSADMEG